MCCVIVLLVMLMKLVSRCLLCVWIMIGSVVGLVCYGLSVLVSVLNFGVCLSVSLSVLLLSCVVIFV